jgi:hypothetical protein
VTNSALYSYPRENSATSTVEAWCFRYSYNTFTDVDGETARDVLPQPTTETPLEAA